ncbi:MAG: rhomboid family intramembrane serine protease [Paludibacteraceae bacterium]|nr:rhomboid family intramembrane serine protease [Paludibacteraceae bacterium]
MQNRTSFWSNIPAVTKNLLIINLIFWLADLVMKTRFQIDLTNWLGLYYIGSGAFHWWQPVTYMFMHANFSHLFFNMFAVFMFAAPLEQQWGSKRFLTYYLVSGIGAGIVQELVWWMMYGQTASLAVTIGASGAVFGILFAFGWLFPDTKLFIFPIPIPIRARIFVIIYAFIELFAGLGNFSGDNVAHFAHLGGLLFGWLLILIWKRTDKSFGATPSNFNLKEWWARLKNKMSRKQKENNPYEGYHYQEPVSNNTDTDKEDDANRQEIDRILDKIRQSGYDSLTDEEKAKLFKK